jgi:putative flippase GtrA
LTFFKYLLIGIVNSIVAYLLIFGFMLLGIGPEVSNFVGYFFGIVVSYVLNKQFNFKSKNRHMDDLPKFLASMAVAYLLNLAALVTLYRGWGVNPYVSQIAAGAVYLLVGYSLSRVWVFRVRTR